MANDIIQTTGGTLYQQDLDFINHTICDVFNCSAEQIVDLQPLQRGLSNSVLTFELYVFRFPGLGYSSLFFHFSIWSCL